jgi:hypothetical protein
MVTPVRAAIPCDTAREWQMLYPGRLEELRLECANARNGENSRAMYHPDFMGWPGRVTAPIGQSEVGGRS